ncbi:6335_t:CDS:2 [Paraglomus occultum]|uniref:6335_t:CDS:1 n=1 Tax=Paraglomus occultum TaxID=144539 RepID=A0A9N9D2C1_9GLOM|nr:6335_t:CDS:2 [Paraglomus occultum]
MRLELTPALLRDLEELFANADNYDVSIQVGEGSESRTFHAHSVILRARSPYFNETLSKQNACPFGGLTDKQVVNVKLHERIRASTFGTLLKYIYTGRITLSEYTADTIFDILLAADDLFLDDLVDQIQDYLVTQQSNWLKLRFVLINRTAFEYNRFRHLRSYCLKLIREEPGAIFTSSDFHSLDRGTLVSLLKRDDLALEEVEIWNRLIKWGIAQNQILAKDVSCWCPEDFVVLQNTLKDCVEHVRFLNMSSEEFAIHVLPYESIIPRQLFRDVFACNMQKSQSLALAKSTRKKLGSIANTPRFSNRWNSVIINSEQAAWITACIDKLDKGDLKFHLRKAGIVKNSFKYRLLLRGSRDGFDHQSFHTLCDDQGATVIIIKVAETGEILGGYNPLPWNQSVNWGETEDSFIFSFKNEHSKKGLLSRVRNADRAVFNGSTIFGPCFGHEDLVLKGDFRDFQCCKRSDYCLEIKNSRDYFTVEEYEVFGIEKRSKWFF